MTVNQLMKASPNNYFFSGKPSSASTSRKRPIKSEEDSVVSPTCTKRPAVRPTVGIFDSSHYNSDQLQYIDHVVKQLDFFPVHNNFSKMGSGKTRATCGIALKLGLPMVILRPRTVTSWEEEADLTGAKICKAMTLGALRSTNMSSPKHGYLIRDEESEEVEMKTVAMANSKLFRGTRKFGCADTQVVKKVSFLVTPKFEALVAKGILLVVDESHGTKNNSDQSRAVSALVNYIVRTCDQHKSKVMCLSGTPYTEVAHVTQVLRVMGLSDGTPWVKSDTDSSSSASSSDQVQVQNYVPSNSNRFVPLCFLTDEALTYSILDRDLQRKTDCEKVAYELFLQVLKPRLVSFLPSPQLDMHFDNKCGFYKTGDFDSAMIKQSIQNIVDATRLNSRGQRVARDGEQGTVNLEMEQIHLAKVDMAVRLAKARLDTKENRHVIIFTQFHSTVDLLTEELYAYNPLVLTGKISSRDERRKIVKSFHKSKSRLLIANMQVGGVGLNLGDMIGDAPRSQLIFPTYLVTELYQSMYRCYRLGTKTDVECRLLFSTTQEMEVKLLESFAKKTKVWNDVLTQQVSEGEKFMSDLPREIEQ